MISSKIACTLSVTATSFNCEGSGVFNGVEDFADVVIVGMRSTAGVLVDDMILLETVAFLRGARFLAILAGGAIVTLTTESVVEDDDAVNGKGFLTVVLDATGRFLAILVGGTLVTHDGVDGKGFLTVVLDATGCFNLELVLSVVEPIVGATSTNDAVENFTVEDETPFGATTDDDNVEVDTITDDREEAFFVNLKLCFFGVKSIKSLYHSSDHPKIENQHHH